MVHVEGVELEQWDAHPQSYQQAPVDIVLSIALQNGRAKLVLRSLMETRASPEENRTGVEAAIGDTLGSMGFLVLGEDSSAKERNGRASAHPLCFGLLGVTKPSVPKACE